MIDAVATLTAYALATCGASHVEIHASAVDDRAVADADALRWSGDPCAPAPVLRLAVLRGDRVDAHYTVRPSLTVHVSAWLAAAPAGPGEPVSAVQGTIPLDRNTASRVPHAGPWEARTPIAAGDPLTPLTVSPLPDARRGDPVQVIVVRGSVRLRAEGRLLADATIGQPVRVHNETTHTALQGLLIDKETVEIQ